MNISNITSEKRGILISSLIHEIGFEACGSVLRQLIMIDDAQALHMVLSAELKQPIDEIMIEDGRLMTMLHLAVKHASNNCIPVLLEFGANPKATDSAGQTAVETAEVYENSQALLSFSTFI